jgi:hypothetical protein
MLIKKLSQA